MTTTVAVPTNATALAGHLRQPAGRHPRAAQDAIDASSTTVRFHLGDTAVKLDLPPLDKLAFYAGLAGAAASGLIECPSP